MNDSIDRQAAIDGADEIIQRDQSGNNDVVKAMTAWKEWVKALPSAKPKRKTGHWVYDENGMDWNLPAWVCSECHGRNDMIPTYIRGKDRMIKVVNPLMWAGSKYCPNCGAYMRGK